MAVGVMASKITPSDKEISPPKKNNFIDKTGDLIHHIRYLIIIQLMLGINRLYLFRLGTFVSRCLYLHSVFMFMLAIYIIAIDDILGKTHMVFKVTSCVTFLLLVLQSVFMYKGTLKSFCQNVTTFDETLNISEHVGLTIQMHRGILWILGSITYSAIEFSILSFFVFGGMNTSIAMIYLTILAHDSEQIFYVTLIRTIMCRVHILKAHIAKAFSTENDPNTTEEVNKVEALSDHAQLDTSGMHKAYELLHKCAEQLNSVMSFPMILMLFSSGLSTTILLKKLFQITQEPKDEDKHNQAKMIYIVTRCVKYTGQVIVPCYYASLTSRQVAIIRTMLHNAVNTFKLDKIERRKIKAFFQLTKDNEFAYALWGVIRLSMSLPLSYASLCTTYLIITIQFSKFID